MPTVGFRAYIGEQTLRALKAQLKLRERRATPYDGQGMQGGNRPWCPWSSAHYPWLRLRARRGEESGSPLRAG